jgi:hypothetical protein
VLEKVSKEVDAINAALQRLYASEDRIGTTGLERLKKTASMPQVAQNVPNLNALIPFLEVTNHQDYLVTRIKGKVFPRVFTCFYIHLCITGGICNGMF